ncbi:MAG: zinc ribbon domain-containing protein [Clostridia bacterium]|nr:zinc ribbon domain-containing protein [Clostridia bacterium]
MADNLNLDYDEIVITKDVSVAHGGVMAIYTDELILTNKKIICLHKGMFGGTKTIYHYPLEQIKVYNGVPQVQKGKLSNGTPCLDVYLISGEEHFNFQSKNKATIDKWIAEINKAFGIMQKVEQNKKSKKRSESDEDSIAGAFKKVGDSFKEVGREFAVAFGFKGKSKKEEIDEEEEKDEEEEAVSNYKLESDESIILRKECVYVFGSLECTADVALLTNKRLVLEYTTGFWNNKNHVDTFPLSDIKLYKNIPQVKMGERDDEPILEISFANSQLMLNFSEVGNEKKQKQCIEEWMDKTLDALSDISIVPPADNSGNRNIRICQSCGKPLPSNVAFCTNCGAKVQIVEEKSATGKICSKCGMEIPVGMRFCTECGAAVEENKPGTPNPIPPTEPIKDSVEEKQKEKLSIDQQIELLQKLKSLVDAGIISQEEFEKKKKEIL